MIPIIACGPDCQAYVNDLGYLVVEECPPTPCLKCGHALRHGKERTYRSHECPMWYKEPPTQRS